MSTSSEHAFAVVESVEADGLRLKFDGEDTAGDKTYKCNTFFKFAAGDRVYCVKDSGTFVAICKIGAPAQSIDADTAKTAETAKTAGNAETAETAESVNEAKAAGRLTDSTDETYYMLVRKSTGPGVLEYARTYENEGAYWEKWFPMGAPADEAYYSAYATPNTDAIIRFRTDYNGNLQYQAPYRSATWYTLSKT